MKGWATSLVLLVACSRAAGPTAATVSVNTPTLFVEAAPQTEQERRDPEVIPPITAGQCPPEVAPAPSSFFGDEVLIRLPGDLQDGEFAEIHSGGVELVGEASLSTCVRDRYATIEWMLIELRVDEPNLEIEHSLFAALLDHRLSDATLIEAEVRADEREGDWVFELGGSRLLATIRSRDGVLVVGMVLVPVADWALVVNSLRESAERTHILLR